MMGSNTKPKIRMQRKRNIQPERGAFYTFDVLNHGNFSNVREAVCREQMIDSPPVTSLNDKRSRWREGTNQLDLYAEERRRRAQRSGSEGASFLNSRLFTFPFIHPCARAGYAVPIDLT